MAKSDVIITVRVEMSFWDALKLRIAGRKNINPDDCTSDGKTIIIRPPQKGKARIHNQSVGIGTSTPLGTVVGLTRRLNKPYYQVKRPEGHIELFSAADVEQSINVGGECRNRIEVRCASETMVLGMSAHNEEELVKEFYRGAYEALLWVLKTRNGIDHETTEVR